MAYQQSPLGSVDALMEYVEGLVVRRTEQEIKVKSERNKIASTMMAQNIVTLDKSSGRVQAPIEGVPAINSRVLQLINATEGLGFHGANHLVPKRELAKYLDFTSLMDVLYTDVDPKDIPAISTAYATTHAALMILSYTPESSGSLELLRAKGSQVPATPQQAQAPQGEGNARF